MLLPLCSPLLPACSRNPNPKRVIRAADTRIAALSSPQVVHLRVDAGKLDQKYIVTVLQQVI